MSQFSPLAHTHKCVQGLSLLSLASATALPLVLMHARETIVSCYGGLYRLELNLVLFSKFLAAKLYCQSYILHVGTLGTCC